MTQSSGQDPSMATIARRGMAGAVVFLMATIIVLLVFEVRQQLEFVSNSAAENVQWSLGQAETELMALEVAILKAQTMPDSADALEEVRLRFDVVYSRIGTLSSSRVLDDLRALPRVSAQLEAAMSYRENWVAVIDGPPADLRAALPAFYDATEVVRHEMRATALAGIALFARIGDQRRVDISNTLFRIAVVTVALVAILLVLIAAVLRLARQRASEALANLETRERMETIISTSLDAVVVVDRAGRIVEYNGAAERVFGFRRDEAIGADMASLIVPEHFRDGHAAGMRRYLKDKTARVIGQGIVQLDARRKDGSFFPVDLSLASAQSPTGEIFVAFMRDISDRVRNERALRRARDRAIAGEKQKADLLAVMSHEMRTPLNGMLATLDLFDKDEMGDAHRRNLRIIRQSGEILLGHVNEVLDISRLDAGRMSLNKARFDLIALLEEVIDAQSDTARARGNTLRLVPPSPLFLDVYSDSDRLRQILLNLVSNAIKFTENGTILIETDASAGLDQAEIRVIDTGVGIDAEDLDRIFDDFVTVDTTYTRTNTGTGLGLGISQRLSAALGGTLTAESEPGEGSVFSLEVPLVPPLTAPPPPVPRHTPVFRSSSPNADRKADQKAGQNETQTERQDLGHGIALTAQAPVAARDHAPETGDTGLAALEATVPPTPLLVTPSDILLVEDNEINREVARRLLERDGHRVTEACDGAEGVAAVHERRFDLVLMDISMPGTDGVTAARMIRSSGLAWSDLPIIATTAHAMPDELEAFHAVGMDAVLTKPINLTRLRGVLNTALLRPMSAQTPPHRAHADHAGDRQTGSAPLWDMAHFHDMRADLDDTRLRAALVQFGAELDAFVTKAPAIGAARPKPSPEALTAFAAEAHRLAGSAGVFGAMPLAEHLRQLQTEAERGKKQDLPARIAALDALWSDTRASLRATGYDL